MYKNHRMVQISGLKEHTFFFSIFFIKETNKLLQNMKCTLLKNIRRQYYPTIFVPPKREGHAGAKNVAYIFCLHYSALSLSQIQQITI